MPGSERGCRWTMLTGLVLAIALSGSSRLRGEETALDRYVAKPDSTYSWKVVRTVPAKGGSQFIVDLKSQTWRTEKDVDRQGFEDFERALIVLDLPRVSRIVEQVDFGTHRGTTDNDDV